MNVCFKTSVVLFMLLIGSLLQGACSSTSTTTTQSSQGKVVVIPRAMCSHYTAAYIPKLFSCIGDIIHAMILSEDEGITAAQFYFTSYDIAKAWATQHVEKAFDAKNSKLIFDPNEENLSSSNAAIKTLSDNGVGLYKLNLQRNKKWPLNPSEKNRQKMHHKFLYFKNNRCSKKSAIITGSYNCTNYANTSNWENIIILDDKESVDLYLEEVNNLLVHCIEHKISESDLSEKISPPGQGTLAQKEVFIYELAHGDEKTKVEVSFASDKSVSEVLGLEIYQGKFITLQGAFMIFSEKNLGKIFISWELAKKSNPACKGVIIVDGDIYRNTVNHKYYKNFYKSLHDKGLEIRINTPLLGQDLDKLMHNKFALITKEDGTILLTSSGHPQHNNNPETWDNTVLQRNPSQEVFKAYKTEFDTLLDNSKAIDYLANEPSDMPVD